MIRCWLFKLSAGQALDAGHSLTARQAGHLSACAKCRRDYEAQSRMISRLAAGSRSGELESPAFLHGKIMARLRESEKPVAPVYHLKASRIFAGLAAIALLAVFLIPKLSDHKPELAVFQSGQPKQPQLPTPKIDLADASKVFSQPLETEVQALAKDARSALDLVAHNFVPAQ